MPIPQRQQIREQLGILEEKLEELGTLALANETHSLESPPTLQFGADVLLHDALDAIRDLGQLVHEQQLFKSIPTRDFLQRISGLLVQDAATQGCDIAIATYGEGKISMEMAELVMGAILSGFRASLKSQLSLSRTERLKHHLFATGSIYLEVKANAGEVQFRLTDDGQGLVGEKSSSITSDRHFQRLRDHIARCGGWFRHSIFESGGGAIEFKVPLSQHRLDVFPIRHGAFEALIPCASVAEVIEKKGEEELPSGIDAFAFDENKGMVPVRGEWKTALRVVVADLQFCLVCSGIGSRMRARRISAEEFVEDGSWLKSFGLFREEGASRALPLLEGGALVQLYKSAGGTT